MSGGNIPVSFKTDPGFCPDCGSILPILEEFGSVRCYCCKRTWGSEVFGSMATSFTVHFNNDDVYLVDKGKEKSNDDEDDAEGPIVDRKCPQCENDKMSYATLQLRSADEGQTVFYTCTKCKFKESENS